MAQHLRRSATLEAPVANRPGGRIASLAEPFGHVLNLLKFQAQACDDISLLWQETAKKSSD